MTEREKISKLICDFNKTVNDFCSKNCDMPQYCDECYSLSDYLLNSDAMIPPVECRSKVYTIILDKVEEYEICSYTVDADGFSFVHLVFEQNGNFYGRTLSIDDFNRKFYLTREEAEKALRRVKTDETL